VRNKPSRRAVAKLAGCPKCGSPPGVACANNKGDERKSVHRERLLAKSPPRPPGTVFGDAFYGTEEWRAVRYQALRLHGGMCQCCGASPTLRSPLHVDHIKPRSLFPDLELKLENLQVLCCQCNLGKSNTDSFDWRKR
jgi:5-methylcytosine-specific restriction endonuclease McrA